MPVHRQQNKQVQRNNTCQVPLRAPVNQSQTPEANEILRLQRMVGNQVVQRLLSSQTSPILRTSRSALATIQRADEPVALTGATINHDRVSVPPNNGLTLQAGTEPAGATDVTYAVVADDGASVASGTTVNNDTGRVTVAADQEGGAMFVEAEQTLTDDSGTPTTTTHSTPLNFTAIPTGITSTAKSETAPAGKYGGEFTHTFTSPAGGQDALEFARVNEHFPAASGTNLNLSSNFGSISVTVNNPRPGSNGWDLDANGTMNDVDKVNWDNTYSARPFIANASNRTPAHALPQEVAATQEFRALKHPNTTYAAPAVATTTHKRGFKLVEDEIKAVTSSNDQEVVEDYVGPTVFQNARANPGTIQAGTDETATIDVDMQGATVTPSFTVQAPDLGATVDNSGELTPGSTAGTVTIRAGDSQSYDETTVTITAPPEPESSEDESE